MARAVILSVQSRQPKDRAHGFVSRVGFAARRAQLVFGVIRLRMKRRFGSVSARRVAVYSYGLLFHLPVSSITRVTLAPDGFFVKGFGPLHHALVGDALGNHRHVVLTRLASQRLVF